jgi:hypothetical protein
MEEATRGLNRDSLLLHPCLEGHHDASVEEHHRFDGRIETNKCGVATARFTERAICDCVTYAHNNSAWRLPPCCLRQYKRGKTDM